MTSARCAQRAHVDDHFAGRLSVSRERQMRVHLVDCGSCRDRYTRQLKLARLDPSALGFEERLRRGLGLARPRLPFGATGLTALAGLLAVGAWLLVPWQPRGPATGAVEDGAGLRARGAGEQPAEAPVRLLLDQRGTQVAGFRTSGEGAPAPATERMAARQELAFTYRNQGDWSHLMVFARDERGVVFWFHPQWTDPTTNPTGVPLSATPGTHELATAVSHNFAPGRLALCALVSRQPLSVRQVEGLLLEKTDAPAALAEGDRAVACQDVQVSP